MDDIRLPADRRTEDGAELRAYIARVQALDRMHRRFLEVVKVELLRAGYGKLNPAQALLAFHIGEDELPVGEMTLRGYFTGENVSYNVTKMVEAGYLEARKDTTDRRSTLIRLSEKGRVLRARMVTWFRSHAVGMARTQLGADLAAADIAYRRLETFWSEVTMSARAG